MRSRIDTGDLVVEVFQGTDAAGKLKFAEITKRQGEAVERARFFVEGNHLTGRLRGKEAGILQQDLVLPPQFAFAAPAIAASGWMGVAAASGATAQLVCYVAPSGFESPLGTTCVFTHRVSGEEAVKTAAGEFKTTHLLGRAAPRRRTGGSTPTSGFPCAARWSAVWSTSSPAWRSRRRADFGPAPYTSAMARPGLVVTTVLLAALLCCRAKEPPPEQKSPEPPSVVHLSPEAVRTAGIETMAAGSAPGGEVLTLTGTLAAKPWTPEEQAALSDAASADAKLRLAEANFQRLSRLFRAGLVARQDLDAARADLDQARAAAAQADAKRANLGLTETGLALERQATIWGLASLPEFDLAQVRPGANVEVSTAAFPDRRFPGSVADVSRSADPETHNFTVRISVEDRSGLLHPQMLATFRIATTALPGLAIPRSALLLEGDGSYVYVVAGDGVFRRQKVEMRESSSDPVAVTAGLSPGQRIVVKGAQLLESERLKSRIRPAEAD